MAKFLRDLLDAEEPLFSDAVKQLERASGRNGIDVRLIADITHKAHEVMREMGLSPQDTTGHELYRALLARIRRDNERIATIIGGNDPSDARHMAPYVLKAAERLHIYRKAWVLKLQKVQELLKANPPLQLMKRLGYDSIDLMLSEKDIYEVYVALRFSEGDAWLRNFNETLKDLKADDFEEREIVTLILDHKTYADMAAKFVAQRSHNVAHCKEVGVIAVVPMQEEFMQGITLKMLSLVLHYMNEIRMYSAYFKLKKDEYDFGVIVSQVLNNDTSSVSHMAGNEIHWRVVQRYFGDIDDKRHPEVFQPHIDPEDLHWQRAEELLYVLDPEMKFWKKRAYVGLLFDGAPVVMNVIDVNNSFADKSAYEQRHVYHFRENLWNEIFARYMGEDVLEHQILANLDSSAITVRRG